MNIPLRTQRRLYNYYVYLPDSFTRRYFQAEAEASPSLRELGADVSAKVANADIALNRLIRRNLYIYFLAYVIYVGVIALVASRNLDPIALSISTVIGAVIFVALIIGLRLRLIRSSAEYYAIIKLFFFVSFLERNAAEWSDSRFRWRVVERLERIARKVEQIPLASRSVAPDVKEETLRLSRSKAQAIRQLELWAIRPAGFIFTDLVHQLVLDLKLIAESRWYDLPEASDFKIIRSRWIFILRIGSAAIIIGGAIFLLAFAAKAGPAVSIIGLILLGIALALLNSAGISTTVIDQYLQTGSKVISRK